MRIRNALLTLLAAALVAAPAASAGTPGKWTQLGQANLANIDEAALARTADGTLHAVWTIPGTNNDTLVHDAIASNGTAAPPNVITTGWAAITAVPDLVTTADGLRVFLGGIRSTDPNEPNSNMNTATAPPSGAAWDLFSGTTVKSDAAYGGDDGAALLPDGMPLLAFGGTGSGTFVHRGLAPATPNFQLQDQLGGCCGYSPDAAVDAKSGAAFVAWISNATNNIGVYAQSLDPGTGAPTGAFAKMPGSSTTFNGSQQMNQQLQRIPIVARAGGGVYVAYPGGYPTTKLVRLWRVADSKSAVVGSSNFDHIVNLAADPDGRLWVFWVERGSHARVFARRSNRAATKFGPAVEIAAPHGQSSAYKIDGSAQSGALDLVVLWGGNSPQQAQFHTQIEPGLALTAKPSKLSKSKPTTVKFTVGDPDPVKGAKVTAGGRSATTNGSGHATITLGPSKKAIRATARKAGYAGASVKLK